jgi:ankyrin repeat protein
LHLAALRGNSEVVDYLVSNCGADASKKDRNGLNPLELSVKKSQLKAEWTLRKIAAKGFLKLISGLKRERLRDSRLVDAIGYDTYHKISCMHSRIS